MEPRARVSVWPGRRRVPGIVAPDSWGARGAECLPCDVPRRSSPATSSRDGTTVRRCLCHGTGSGTTEARPPASSVPPASWGSGGLSRHAANPGPDFRSSSSSFLPEKMNRHCAKKARERCVGLSAISSLLQKGDSRVMSLGHPSYPRPKGTRNHSMAEKRGYVEIGETGPRKTRVAWSKLDRLNPNPDRGLSYSVVRPIEHDVIECRPFPFRGYGKPAR